MKVIYRIDPVHVKGCVVRLRGRWGWWNNRRPRRFRRR